MKREIQEQLAIAEKKSRELEIDKATHAAQLKAHEDEKKRLEEENRGLQRRISLGSSSNLE